MERKISSSQPASREENIQKGAPASWIAELGELCSNHQWNLLPEAERRRHCLFWPSVGVWGHRKVKVIYIKQTGRFSSPITVRRTRKKFLGQSFEFFFYQSKPVSKQDLFYFIFLFYFERKLLFCLSFTRPEFEGLTSRVGGVVSQVSDGMAGV